MPIINLPINIGKSEVLRHLGYRDADSQKLLLVIEEQIDMAIQEAFLMAEPKIIYNFFKVVNAKDKKYS